MSSLEFELSMYETLHSSLTKRMWDLDRIKREYYQNDYLVELCQWIGEVQGDINRVKKEMEEEARRLEMLAKLQDPSLICID